MQDAVCPVCVKVVHGVSKPGIGGLISELAHAEWQQLTGLRARSLAPSLEVHPSTPLCMLWEDLMSTGSLTSPACLSQSVVAAC